jgi:hypothetical protein
VYCAANGNSDIDVNRSTMLRRAPAQNQIALATCVCTAKPRPHASVGERLVFRRQTVRGLVSAIRAGDEDDGLHGSK